MDNELVVVGRELKIAHDGIVHKVAWLHFNDGQVLFARSRGQTLAYTVGGKPKVGEWHFPALVREVREEAGVKIIVESIKFYGMFEGPCYGYVPGTILKMWCYAAGHSGTIKENGEVEELLYLDGSDIGTGRTTELGDTILRQLQGDGLIRHSRQQLLL